MKAIVCTQYGAPEVLKLKEVEKPTPKKGEVLIKIKATSVTASDVLIRGLKAPGIFKWVVQLAFGFGKPRNPIMGMVLSGVIEETGEGVSNFNVGEDVFAYCSVSPLKHRFGSYAEYICLPEDWNLLNKPKNLSHEEAAAMPYGGFLASYMLKKTEISQGDEVLIYGASGSIGTMAIQLAKQAGANVTAVCSSKNHELVKELGSTDVIDYKADHAISQLKKYKYVIDAVGNTKSSALKEASKRALVPGGKYISIDHGTPNTPKETFENLKRLAEIGSIKPVIDRVYPLEQMQEAHSYVELGHKVGNVVVTV